MEKFYSIKAVSSQHDAVNNPACLRVAISEGGGWNTEIKDVSDLNYLLLRAIEVIRGYAACSDGCTCGDGWSHDEAQYYLGKVLPKDFKFENEPL